MIKFFRKIRQKLLSEGKTGKYFKYAIGEIVLVMIGILLALQVNNWNEARKVANKELQLYSDILNDLESEYSKSEWNINRITRIDRFHVYLYDEANGDTIYNSNQYYNYLLWKHRYVTFIKEKYAESFAIITNKEIHKILKDYIDQENDTNDAVEEWNEHQLQYVRPFLTKYNISNPKAMFN
ncbi:MAG: hypothetical protein HKN96_13675, partial [Flavobacteriaceae bacterium]|nr:hypothetical protein [Flavobacteriaceae bacterium]